MQQNQTYQNFKYFIKEFIAGTMSGLATVIVGQPFDTIKVRIQSESQQYKNSLDCAKQILQKESFFAFYKGSLSPIIGNCLTLSLFYGFNGFFKKLLKLYGYDNDGQLSYNMLFISGSMAAFVQAIAIIPTEHVRIRMQIQKGSVKNHEYKSVIDCYKKIYKRYGIQGLYKGTVASMWREIIPGGIYMLFYTYLCNKMEAQKQKKSVRDTIYLFSGASTGVLFWLISYPFDTIKTKMQSDCFQNPSYKSFIQCSEITYQNQGIKGFYTGLTICLQRAAPANGVQFLVFERTMQFLNQIDKDI